jgi:hypothetical protein
MKQEKKIKHSISSEFAYEGYLYCLSTPLVDGVYMIGCTRYTIAELLKQKNSINEYCSDFNLECAKIVKDCIVIEKIMNILFDKYRIDKNKNVFNIPLDKILNIFEMIEGEEYI